MTEERLSKTVGNVLKESGKNCGYTQKNVAELMHITQQQYSRFENGVFELNYEQIVFLCGLYDISADLLFGLVQY